MLNVIVNNSQQPGGSQINKQSVQMDPGSVQNQMAAAVAQHYSTNPRIKDNSSKQGHAQVVVGGATKQLSAGTVG